VWASSAASHGFFEELAGAPRSARSQKDELPPFHLAVRNEVVRHEELFQFLEQVRIKIREGAQLLIIMCILGDGDKAISSPSPAPAGGSTMAGGLSPLTASLRSPR